MISSIKLFRSLLPALVVMCCTALHAQSAADSLGAVLSQKDLSIEDRIVTMCRWAHAQSETDTEKAIRTTQQALHLGKGFADGKYEAFSYGTLVELYHLNGNRAQAKVALDSALWFAHKTNDTGTKGFVFYQKALLESETHHLNDAIKSSLQALAYLKDAKAFAYEADVHHLLSALYGEQGDSIQQKKQAELCLQAAHNSADAGNLAAAHEALGAYFASQFNQHPTQQNLLDSALLHNRLAMRLFTTAHPPTLQRTLAEVAFSTGLLYEKHFPKEYRDTVVQYMNLAVKAGTAAKQFDVTAFSYQTLSDYQMADGRYDNAETLLQSALKIVQPDSIAHPNALAHVLRSLSAVSEKKGNSAKALAYYKRYYAVMAHKLHAETLASTSTTEATDNIHDDGTNAAHDTASNLWLIVSLAGLVIASAVALFFISKASRLQTSTAQLQKQMKEKKEEDAALQAQLKTLEEKQRQAERQELALKARINLVEASRKALEQQRREAEHQLQHERQERLQTTNITAEQKNELLKVIRKKISDAIQDRTVLKQVNTVIDQHKKSEEALDKDNGGMESIRPDFFEQLKEKSGDSLSRLDLKHCAFISLGLSNKEIAQRMGVVPKSVLMSRYRIKQKLALPKEEDLDHYIQTLSK